MRLTSVYVRLDERMKIFVSRLTSKLWSPTNLVVAHTSVLSSCRYPMAYVLHTPVIPGIWTTVHNDVVYLVPWYFQSLDPRVLTIIVRKGFEICSTCYRHFATYTCSLNMRNMTRHCLLLLGGVYSPSLASVSRTYFLSLTQKCRRNKSRKAELIYLRWALLYYHRRLNESRRSLSEDRAPGRGSHAFISHQFYSQIFLVRIHSRIQSDPRLVLKIDRILS